MLEAAGFDFRNRHPQRSVVKLARSYRLPRESVGKTAYDMSLDMYRTFAPLKQTTSTMALACIELAARLHKADLTPITAHQESQYRRWSTSRAEVMGA